MDSKKSLENDDLMQEIHSDSDATDIIDCESPSTSSSNILPELQGLTTFPLVSPPRRAIFFCKPKEYREYQHPIPPMSPTPLPAHCNSTACDASMNPMHPPLNLQHPYNLDYRGAPPLLPASDDDLCMPTYTHTNNLPLARLVYRAMQYTPVYQPLLGRNNPTPNVAEDLSKQKKKNTTRHLCTDCKKTYATASGLSKHQRFYCSASNDSKKPITCKTCGEVCESFAAFKLHSNTHILPCKCHVCDKSFSKSSLLQDHMRTHTGEKPFLCQQCKRSFADRSNLRVHIQAHNNVRKHSCRICSKSFTRMSLLMKHTKANCPAQQALMTAIEKHAQTM